MRRSREKDPYAGVRKDVGMDPKVQQFYYVSKVMHLGLKFLLKNIFLKYCKVCKVKAYDVALTLDLIYLLQIKGQ